MEKKEVTKGENITQELNTRNVSYDLLRICAAVMVVLLHIAASNWYSVSPDKAEWVAMNLYDSMARSAVPLFFMLSGAFFIEERYYIKRIVYEKDSPFRYNMGRVVIFVCCGHDWFRQDAFYKFYRYSNTYRR